MIWYFTWPIFIDFIFWPTEVIDIWRSIPPWTSLVKKGSQNRIGTPKIPVIWYLTWLIFIDFIFWPPVFIDIWRSRPPGSSKVKQGVFRIELGHWKTYDLIPHMTHLHWFDILTVFEVVIEGRSNWKSYIWFKISTLCMG